MQIPETIPRGCLWVLEDIHSLKLPALLASRPSIRSGNNSPDVLPDLARIRSHKHFTFQSKPEVSWSNHATKQSSGV
jgi:hypothetical protein